MSVRSEQGVNLAELRDLLHRLGDEIIGINIANGWNVLKWTDFEEGGPYRIPTSLALLHSEVSEALEAFRREDKENFAEELADVQIRLLDLSHGLGIDLGQAILDKLAKNRERGFRHGGKKV